MFLLFLEREKEGVGVVIRWSLSAELFSAILLALLLLSYRGKDQVLTRRRKMYLVCLWLSMGSILLNVLCVLTIDRAHLLPLWLNLLLNSLYFFSVVILSTVMAAYLFELILEHVYDGHCLRRAHRLLAFLGLLYGAVVLWNLRSGVLFYFDEGSVYHRGPLNGLGYLFLTVELAALVLCYLRNRPSVSRDMVHVMRTLPPLVVLLMVFQQLFPEILLNGAIVTLADLVLYISFQSRRVELDSLTSVGNRISFQTELALRLDGGQRFQVILAALQQFADVNRRFGHQMGDAFLYEVARELERRFPQGRVYRFSNVEFALLLPFPEDGGEARLRLLQERFAQPWTLGSAQAVLNVRLAELLHDGQAWTSGQVLEYLEYAMNLARREGAPLVRFRQEMARALQRQKDLVALMRQSLRERRFRVWYQPVWESAAGAFTSAEALLRLSTPAGEPISPAEFIPLAEENGLIDELSWLVLEEVCRLLSSGAAPGLESVSINLSMQQFLDPGLIPRLRGGLEAHRLAPHRLKIEITERVVAQDAVRTAAVMEELSRLGIRFYLDDFGTGWANLSCALDLPFQCIKLDHSLLAAYPDSPQSRKLVHGLLSLFHDMGVQVVSEGVETQAQADALCQRGVDWLQGYHLARPMPEEELCAFLARHAAPGRAAQL